MGRAHHDLQQPLSREQGWLGLPPGTGWVEHPSDNPFLRYREMLWSYREAESDAAFVRIVEQLDETLGFRITPFGYREDLGAWAKDETGNVAGSHKARHMMGLAIRLAVEEVPLQQRLAISSCGNAAFGAATVARAAGRPLDVYIPPWADTSVVDALDDLGAAIHVCPRRGGEVGDPCMLRFREAVAEGSLPFGAQATDNVWTIDGGKTLGWELVSAGLPQPAALYVQVGGGALMSSVVQGLVDGTAPLPRCYAVQAEGAAPLARAWAKVAAEGGLDGALARPDDYMWEWDNPHSLADGIIDDVTYDWLPIAWGLLATAGDAVVVPEPVIEATQVAGVSPTGSAGLAGLRHRPPPAGEAPVVLLTGVGRSR